ncbi:hypothetical protein KS4_19500 [Poriferisphaera corsica]|uniref:Phosphotriesterase-related protein n=1 Tax=Poriferisphaera corsica TaxID=2528020 RepID=A0A517YUJ0_9BACT|nr:aryldialkylphosphatase [Poriferisphaera corsica]QDU33890.1 hypothetical protein KS4_19500 [Poriferisphaera corsica]
MGFVRTIIGDIEAAGLGICDAHEHVCIDGAFIKAKYPSFLLDDVDVIAENLRTFRRFGGGWIIDTMPTGPGRNIRKLQAISKQSGVAIVCPTGMHLSKYYQDDHAMLRMGCEELAALFKNEIMRGAIDDKTGEQVGAKAGVIKVASGLDGAGVMNALEREAFVAASRVSLETGCPIITHVEQGAGGMEQIEVFAEEGVDLGHVVLSHCDKVHDVGYHRAMLETGVGLEYDNHFRELAKGEDSGSIRLMKELGEAYGGQIVVGMDLARRSYWPGYGGKWGASWLASGLKKILIDRGIAEGIVQNILIDNAAELFSFRKNAICCSDLD